jgi:dTDP-4-dehydrorhamnose 3,5-epimerase
MKFTPGPIEGLWVVDVEPRFDHRGLFARSWCREEFAEHGMVADWAQSSLQVSPEPGTMRGLHYQLPPHGEDKLVRCTRGAVFDVSVDLRPASPTYRGWFGVELTAESHRSVWSPKGCAHGYLTLRPDTEAFYLTSHEYVPAAVAGIRYDDPAFAIEWPRPVEMAPPDCDTWPFYDEDEATRGRQQVLDVQPPPTGGATT